MNRKEHIKVDKLLLGYTYPIHSFIDSYESLLRYGASHRKERHNEKILNIIFDGFGKKAYYVALLHLLVDFDIVMDRKELKKYI